MSSTIPISACHCIQTEKQTESSLSRPKVLPSNNNNKKLLRDAGAEAAVGAACSQLRSRVGVPPPPNLSHVGTRVIGKSLSY